MIVAGFGFRAGADVTSLKDALMRASEGCAVQALSTASDKASSEAFVGLARSLSLPILAVDPADMSRMDTPTQSSQSQAARETGSVAEASALSAAGPGSTLLTRRVISADRFATCALARTGQEGNKT